MEVQDAIALMNEHVDRWNKLMKKAANNEDFNAAQSYADMIYGVRAMIQEIERELYKEV